MERTLHFRQLRHLIIAASLLMGLTATAQPLVKLGLKATSSELSVQFKPDVAVGELVIQTSITVRYLDGMGVSLDAPAYASSGLATAFGTLLSVDAQDGGYNYRVYYTMDPGTGTLAGNSATLPAGTATTIFSVPILANPNNVPFELVENAFTTPDINFYFKVDDGFVPENNDGFFGIHNATTGIYYGSIQHAINGASSGNEIDVPAGTYAQSNCVVDKPLTIVGESAASVAIVPATTDDHSDSRFGGAVNNAFVVRSSGVTLHAMTIDGDGGVGGSGSRNFRNAVVADNLTGNYDNTHLDGLIVRHIARRGVDLRVLNAHTSGHEITNSSFTDVGAPLQDNGAAIAIFGGDALIDNNTITSCTNGMFCNGVYDGGNHLPLLTITRNQISSISHSVQGVGMNLAALASGSVIGGATAPLGNSINTTGGTDIEVGVMVTFAAGTVSVRHNTFTSTAGDGALWLFRDEFQPVAVADNQFMASSSSSSADGEGTAVFITDDPTQFGENDCGIDRATLTGNTISGYAHPIDVLRKGTLSSGPKSLYVTIGGASPSDDNSIVGSGSGTGIQVLDTDGSAGENANVTISNNNASIHGFAIGIDVNGGSATISTDHIYDNGIGVKVSNGGTVSSLDNINFAGATDNGTDLQLLSSAGTVTIGSNNAFAGDTYYIDNQSSQNYNLSSNGTTYDQADNFAREDRMYHKLDNAASGLVTVVANNTYVSAPGTGSGGETIQRGIDAASNGWTVNVAAGTFAENVLVSKQVTVKGQGAASTTVVPATSNPNCGGGGGGSLCAGGSNVFLVQEDNVTIQDLTVDGHNAALTHSGETSNGVAVDARNGIITDHTLGVMDNLVVHDVTVQNIYLRGMYTSSGGTFNLHHNTVTNVQGDAASIAMFNWVGSGTMAYNVVSQAGDGISANHSSGTEFHHNTITDCASGIHTDNAGDGGGTADNIHDNTVSNGQAGSYGVWAFASYLPVAITNNSVDGVAVGLMHAGSSAPAGVVTLSGNEVSNSDYGFYQTTSLFYYGDVNATSIFSNNKISGCTTGITLETNATYTRTLTANQNSITGATVGAERVTSGTDVDDLTCNYWGVATVPGVVALQSGTSNYLPFDDDGTDTSVPTLGYQPAPAACGGYPVTNLNTSAGYMTIQAAVNAATPGDVIEASAYVFNERVTIDRTLTLQGVSETGTVIDGTSQMVTGKGITINTGVTGVTIRNLTVRDFAGSSGNADAGIYAIGGNDNLLVENVTIRDNVGGSGFYANGPVNNVTLTNIESFGHTVGARGIVIWNGLKSNITITYCDVYGNNCCGIELQDGTATGVTMHHNNVHDNGDNGMGLVGLTGPGANLIQQNTLVNNGRFGIEVKNPNGNGATSGPGSVVIDNNNVSRTVAIGDARDIVGIAAFRRSVLPENVDIPTGVVIQNNTISGYTQASTSDGFGIVVEGTNHSVTGNSVSGCDVGIQRQAGHTPYPGDGDQSNLADQYFGRGNSPVACGIDVSGSTFSSNTTNTRDVPGSISTQNGFVQNMTTGNTYCTIQAAIDAASTVTGHVLHVSDGTYTENVVLNKSITLEGESSAGTIITAPVACSGIGVNVTAANATVSHLTTTNFQSGVQTQTSNTDLLYVYMNANCARGLELGNGTSDLLVDHCQINNNTVTGIRSGTASVVNNVLIDNSEVKGNLQQGTFIAAAAAGAAFDNVTIQNSDFSNNKQKGIYMERANHLLIDNIVMDNSGTDATYGFNNGIDLNFKFNDFVDVAIRNSDFTNCGATGTAVALDNPAVIAIKARNDGGTYGPDPATLAGVVVYNNTIHGPRNGLRLGEFGTTNTGPTGVVIEHNDLDFAFSNKALLNNTNTQASLICNWHGAVSIPTTLGGTGSGGFNLLTYSNDVAYSNCAAPVSIAVNGHTDASCAENNDGTAQVTASGGVGGYTFSWTGPVVTAVEDPTNLLPGLYTVTVTDGYTSASAQVTIGVHDVTLPTITCPAAPPAMAAEIGLCSAHVYALDPIYGDNCGSPVLTYVLSGATIYTSLPNTTASGHVFNVGTTTVTYTITDASNNTASCNFNVVIIDNQSPTAACPGNQVVNTDPGTCTTSLDDETWPTVLDNCSVTFPTSYTLSGATPAATVPVNYPFAHTILFWKGITTVDYDIQDQNGNNTTCSFTVTVNDNQPPVVSCPANIAVGTNNLCTALVNTGLNATSVTDNCSATLSYTLTGATILGSTPGQLSSYAFNKGVTTVTYNATDGVNSAVPCSFTVTVSDDDAPVITTTAGSLDLTVSCASGVPAVNPNVIAATDNCPDALIYTHQGDVISAQTCANRYTITRTYRVADIAGNFSQFVQIITVNDQTGPVIGVAASNSTVACDGSGNSAQLAAWLASNGGASATDGCGGTISWSNNFTALSDLCGATGAATVIFTAADVCGNTSTTSATFTIQDNTAPSFTRPSNITIYTNASCGYDASIGVTGDVTNESDNCSSGLNATFTDVVSNGACTGAKSIARTWHLVDDCGNAAVDQVQTITVLDNTAPLVPAPGTIAAIYANTAAAEAAAIAAAAVSATDNCTTLAPANFSASTVGTCPVAVVTVTVTDACGNATQVNYNTRIDGVAPVITCPGNLSANTVFNTCAANVTVPIPGISDVCGGPFTVTYTISAPTNRSGSDAATGSFSGGVSTVVYTVSDGLNTSQCSMTVTVIDNQTPVIGCPLAQTFNTDPGVCYAQRTIAPTSVTDNCTPSGSILRSYQLTGATTTGGFVAGQIVNVNFLPGVTTVTYRATDASLNVSNCTFTVTVNDNQAPLISCPANTTVPNTPGLCSAVVNGLNPTITENCTNNLTYTRTGAINDSGSGSVSGLVFPKGTTTVQYTVTEAHAPFASANCSFTVTVNDTEAPVIGALPALSTINCPAAPSFATATATDNCVTVTLTFNDVTTNGACAGQYSVTRTWTATDGSGNNSTATQTINVQDITAPVIDPLPAVSTINCPATPSFATATATDACGSGAVLTFNDVTTNGACAGQYSVTRTWTATDGCGNASTATQTINVQDITAPVIDPLPAVSTINCPATPSFATATATDACGSGAVLTFNDVTTNGACAGQYSVTRTWTATDGCGNASTATQTINVQDITAPVIDPLPAVSTINCPATPSFATATATDACGSGAVLTFNDVTTNGACAGQYSVTRTWTATDGCGNASTATQTINVQDITAPVIDPLPAVSTINCPATPSFAAATATDACGSGAVLTFNDVTTNGACAGQYSVTRTWTATDGCGNASTATQTINVQDITAPVIDPLPAVSTINCPATPSFATATATDACGSGAVLTFNDVTTNGACAGQYSVTRTWTATDGCGNASTATQTINVQDITAPVIDPLPAVSTINCPATPSFATATATDACGSGAVLTFNDVTTNGACAGQYSVTRTWTATDGCGNASTATQTINVQDITAPVIDPLPAVSTINCPATPSFATATATDACGSGAVLTFNDVTTNGACAGQYSVTRTWTATDGCGNASTATQTINVQDITAPVIDPLPAVSTINCPATPSFATATATDACGSGAVLTFNDVTTNGACAGQYSVTRTWTATDGCGNASTATQTINVQDITAPVIDPLPAVSTINCPATPSFAAATATDACGSGAVLTFNDVTTNGACAGQYSVTRTWTATDGCGNASTATQTINVQDITAPVIDPLPAVSTINCPATPSFATATATDACGSGAVLTFNDVTTNGACAGQYSVTRTWTATDGCGNASTATQTINVQDITAPVIDPLPAVSTINCPATPSFATATATDACGSGAVLTFNDVNTNGACAGQYSVTRTWTATDGCGNASTATQTINVQDITAPVIDSLPAVSTINCPATPSFATATATDACGSGAVLTFNDVTTNGACAGQYSVTRTWTATDGCGNASTATQTINVQDITAPVIDPLPAVSTINCPATPSFATATATDACGSGAVLTFNDVTTNGACAGQYSVTRTWTATDGCGNASTATQTINVQDITAPVIDPLPAVSTINCPATPSFATATATDACGSGAVLTFNDVTTNGACAGQYSVTRTWTATDGCGNASTATQTINVQDITAPVIDPLPAVSTINCPATPSFAAATATDACGSGAVLTFNDVTTNGACAGQYSVTRTWTATDGCGNASTATQTINVQDITAPVIDPLPAVSTINCPATPSFATATATDACGSGAVLTFNDVTTNGACAGQYSVTRTWTATDGCGNASTATQTINVQDITAPVIDPLPAVSTINCPATPSFAAATATDACGSGAVLTFNDVTTNGACAGQYSVTRTWTATDGCGNASTATQTINVQDITAPVIDPLPAVSTINCPATPSFATATATDACGSGAVLTFNDVTTNGACAGQYSVTRTWTATDGCGNASTATQTINVQDITAPVIDPLPAVSTINCPATPSFATATATDACGSGAVLTFNDVTTNGACAGQYSVTRTWTATDGCGNASTATQTINVQDITAPVIVPGTIAPIYPNAAAAEAAAIAAAMVGTTDSCMPLTPANYSASTLGTCSAVVTLVVNDGCGNSSSTTYNTVIDNQTPVIITCPGNQPAVATLPNLCYANVTLAAPTYTDNCTGNVTVTYAITGATVRSGSGAASGQFNGGVSTVVYTVTDGLNFTTCSFTVTVVDNQAPFLTCPLSSTIPTDPGQCYATANIPAPVATDNCSPTFVVEYSLTGATNTGGFVLGQLVGVHLNTGVTNVVYKVTDLAGNSALCPFTVTVNDGQAPSIICPSDVVVGTQAPLCTATIASGLQPTITENCNPALTYVLTGVTGGSGSGNVNGFTFNKGVTTVTYTVNDGVNTPAVCSFTVTVNDDDAPTFTAPADLTIYSDAHCGYDVTVGNAGDVTNELDNCSSGIQATFTDGVVALVGCEGGYTITRTWSLVDGASNTTVHIQTITVLDNTVPTFTRPANATIFTDASCGYDAGVAFTGDVTNEADNCSTGLNATFTDVTVDGACEGSHVITRTWHLVDNCGNAAADQVQTINVNDNTVPTFTRPIDATIFTDASCGYDAGVAFTGDVTNEADNCSTGIQATFTDVTVDGACEGSHVITRTWHLVDNCGNAAADQVQTINVNDNTVPTFTRPADATVFTSASCTYDASVGITGDVTNEADNCSTGLNATFTDVTVDGACEGSHVITRTWHLVDNCGNAAADQVQTINVNDNTVPTFTRPIDATIFTDASCGYDAGVAFTGDVTNELDNCSTGIQATFTDVTVDGACEGSHVITRTWHLVDNCGNAAADQVQTINVNDNTVPTFTRPIDATIFTDASCGYDAGVAFTGDVTNEADNCSTGIQATFTDVTVDGACEGSHVITRTWHLVDNCGNAAADQVQTINVNDNTVPTFTRPADATVFTSASCTYDASVGITGDVTNEADNCSTGLNATFTDVTVDGACEGSHVITRTWHLVDNCGNAAADQVQTINVNDNTVPTFTRPIDATIFTDASCGYDAGVAFTGDVTNELDNCSTGIQATFTDVTVDGACEGSHVITRTWHLVDNCGNAAADQVQTINVNDNTVPTFTRPIDATIFTDASCGYDAGVAFTGDVTNEADNCSTGIQATFTDVTVDGACEGSHVITRTWHLVDNCGNAAADQVQTINVNDNTVPTFTRPADATVFTSASCTYDASVGITGDVTNEADNCSTGLNATFTDVTVDGACEGSHVITRTWHLVDNCGNAAADQVQTINVNDNTVPTFTRPIDATIFTDASCGYDAGVAFTGDVTNELDNCSTGIQATFTDVTVDGACEGSHVITRTWHLVDNCGNAAADQVQTINVNDNTVPTFTRPIDATIFTDASCGYDAGVAFTGDVTNEADNCSTGLNATFTDVTVDGACEGSHVITRTWHLVDNCGNAAADQVQTINVNDNTVPTFTRPADATVFTSASCTYDASVGITGDVTNEADNCSTGLNATFTDVTVDGACEGSHVITRTWHLVDNCGNAAADQVQTINVNDNTVPTFTRPIDATIFTDASCGYDAGVAFTGDVTNELDNCSTGIQATFTDVTVDGACEGSHVITRTWHLVDNCGNAAADQVQTINVNDNTVPTFTRPIDATIFTDASCGYDAGVAFTGDVTNEADNCSTGIQATFTDVTVDGACEGSHVITRTWHLVDNCGNAAADQVQTINVNDNTVPTFTRPADATVFTSASCTYDASVGITGDVTNEADNCSTGLNATFTDVTVDGACEGSHVITRTWHLVDNCGNAAADQVQTINVNDNTVPTFTRPIDATIFTDASCGYDAGVAFTGDVTNELDNCSTGIQATFTDVTVDGACEGSHVITRTWHLVDNCGNAAADQVQTINVNDNTVPTFTRPIDATIFTDASCGYDAGVAFTGDVTNEADNCSTGLNATFTDVTVDGACEGSHVITRTWHLVDNCGNAAADQVQTINVNDNTVPTFTRPADATVFTSASCTYDASVGITGDVTNEADNCSTGLNATFTDVTVDGACEGSHVITRTWHLVDNCGNAAADQVQTINVNDNTVPLVTAGTINAVYPSVAAAQAAALAATTATDNCTVLGPANYSVGTTGTCNAVVTVTVTDNCGNSAHVDYNTAIDNQGPVFAGCPLDIFTTTNVGACDGATVNWTAPSATDNCAMGTVIQTVGLVSGSYFPLGNTTITYTATDVNGNISLCTFVVHVSIVDTDGDGVCDFNDNCPLVQGQIGSICDDLNPNTTGDVLNSLCVCVGTPFVDVTVRAMLEGPYVQADDLMGDKLRDGSLIGVTYPLIPSADPYFIAPFSYGGSETVTPAVLAVTGNNAIVDWVLLELRNSVTPATVLYTRAGLLQRDGDIVDVDGVSPVRFMGTPTASYYVAVRHRNHLGIMTATAYPLSGTPSLIDLSVASTPTYSNPPGPNFGDGQARKVVGSRMVMWEGNTKEILSTDRLRYTGSNNDRDAILLKIGGVNPTATLNGYHTEDGNMNGQVKYTGAANDRDPILVNIGGSTPTNQRFQQLP